MHLILLTPQEKKEFTITWLEVDTSVGNFVIQEGHAPTVLILSPYKILKFGLHNGGQEMIDVKSGGIVKITRNLITLLLHE